MENAVEKKPRKKSKLVLLIFILLLAIIILLLLFWKGYEASVQAEAEKLAMEREPRSKYARDVEALAGTLSGLTPEEIQQRLDTVVEEGMFNVSMNTVVHVKEGKGDVRIENISANKYLMQVDIVITDSEDTQVTVYSSGVLEPGYSIENGTFVVDLPKDSAFDATAIFTALEPETMNEVGKTNMKIVLLAETGG